MIRILKSIGRAVKRRCWVYRKIVLVASTGEAPSFELSIPVLYRWGDENDLPRFDGLRHRYDEEAVSFARERLGAGDRLALGEISGQIVFYGWLSFGQMDLQFRRFRTIAPDCAYSYKIFTVDNWRGQNIMPGYYRYVRPILRRMGYKRIVCWVSADNRSSLRSHRRAGFRQIGAIWELCVYHRTFHFIGGATLKKLNKPDPHSDSFDAKQYRSAHIGWQEEL